MYVLFFHFPIKHFLTNKFSVSDRGHGSYVQNWKLADVEPSCKAGPWRNPDHPPRHSDPSIWYAWHPLAFPLLEIPGECCCRSLLYSQALVYCWKVSRSSEWHLLSWNCWHACPYFSPPQPLSHLENVKYLLTIQLGNFTYQTILPHLCRSHLKISIKIRWLSFLVTTFL